MSYLFCRYAGDRGFSAQPAEEPFIAEETPDSLRESVEKSVKQLERVCSRYSLPGVLTVVEMVCLAAVLFLAYAVIDGVGDIPLIQVCQRAPGLFWGAGCALAVAGVLFAVRRVLHRKMERSEDVQNAVRQLEDADSAIAAYHAIPDDAVRADVLKASLREGKSGPEISGAAALREMTVFRRDGGLCLHDLSRVYSLPLGDGACLRLAEQPVPLPSGSWNKRDKPSRKEYRKCGVIPDSAGAAGLRFFCVLEFRREGETYGLLFPAYELPAMERLTGLEAPRLPPATPADKRLRRGGHERSPSKRELLRPRFCWLAPKDRIRDWMIGEEAFVFRAEYPVLFGVLVCVGILLLLVPGLVFGRATGVLSGANPGGWSLVGVFCGFIFGVGLFNIVSAWMHQYMGHIVTLTCFLLGAAIMAVSWHCLL